MTDATRSDGTDGDADRLVGTLLDRYHVTARLGEGGMGDVYAGENVAIGRKVAIKVLRRDIVAAVPSAVERFHREARAAAAIGHPNIVDVLDFVTTPDGRVAIVMEFLIGRDLAHLITKERRLPAIRAVHIAEQIARAMVAAHGAGIIHRDLKPENVFLIEREDEPDYVKVLDFGIAGQLAPMPEGERLTRPGLAFGTPEYMAPEQVAGMSDVDGRADIYSLGAILYEALTGRVPHEGETPLEVLTRKFSVPISPPSVWLEAPIPAELESLIMRMLESERRKRPASMSDVQRELARLGRAIPSEPDTLPAIVPLPAPVAASEDLSPPDLSPPRRRWRAVHALAAAAMLAAIGVAIAATREDVAPSSRAASPTVAPRVPASVALDAGVGAVSPIASVSRVPDAAVVPSPPSPASPSPSPGRPSRRSRPTPAEDGEPAGPSGSEWVRLGQIHAAAGRLDEAETAYFRASASTDRRAAAAGTLGLAEIALRRKRHSEAVKFAQRAIERGADQRRGWSIIGQATCALGDAASAEEAFAKATQPGHQPARCAR